MKKDGNSAFYNRRQFMASVAAAVAGASNFRAEAEQPAAQAAVTASARSAKRVFVAEFSHETNTFHPLKTDAFSYSQIPAPFLLAGWKEAGLIVVPGTVARPNSGGTIGESACREAIGRVLDSLRGAG